MTMTDRWDTIPGGAAGRRAADSPPTAARAVVEPATAVPAAASAAPADSTPPPTAGAGSPPTTTPEPAATGPVSDMHTTRIPGSDPGIQGGASHFDHDAPTAKLPAVPKPRPKREPIKKPGPFPVIAGSAGLFFAVVALLGFQMRAGADPALGKGKPVVVAQATPAPRKVLVRRVVVTRIVEHRPRRGAATAAGGGTGAGASPGGGASSGGGGAASAPSAPSQSAPAPAPAAPAPAPAPAAPLTTQSS